jgi:hypothetical protein
MHVLHGFRKLRHDAADQGERVAAIFWDQVVQKEGQQPEIVKLAPVSVHDGQTGRAMQWWERPGRRCGVLVPSPYAMPARRDCRAIRSLAVTVYSPSVTGNRPVLVGARDSQSGCRRIKNNQ